MTTFDATAVEPGDELAPMVVEITPSHIVAGAVATRDFMPVHHDRAYANVQGAPDIFMNILSDTAYCSRFLTDWAGPDARVTRLAIRLGVPLFPDTTLTYSGRVSAVNRDDDSVTIEVEFSAVTHLGEHVGGTATLDLPVV